MTPPKKLAGHPGGPGNPGNPGRPGGPGGPGGPGNPEILPLFVACFILGLQAAEFFPAATATAFLLLFLCGLGAVFLLPPLGRLGWVPMLITGILLGGFTAVSRRSEGDPVELSGKLHDLPCSVEGRMAGGVRFNRLGGVRFYLDHAVLKIASQTLTVPGRIRCAIAGDEVVPEPGQRYVATGTFKVYSHRRFPEVHAAAMEIRPQLLAASPWLGQVQFLLRDTINSLLSAQHRAFILGILLGDTSQITRADKETLRVVGISHLLAISGQHILILAFLVVSLLSWLGVPPLSRCLVTSGFLVFYGLLTPGHPSVWRAVLMYICGTAALHIEADPGPIRPVALAALLVLLYSPAWVHQIGFQMSFIAVLGILLGGPVWERLFQVVFRLPLVAARYLGVCCAANVAVLPLAGHYFGAVSLVSFLANPLFIGAFGLILPLGICLAVLGSFWFNAGVALAAALAVILDGFGWAVERMSQLPFASVSSPFQNPLAVALAYAALLATYQFLPRRLGVPEAVGVPVKSSRRPTPDAPVVLMKARKRPVSSPSAQFEAVAGEPGVAGAGAWAGAGQPGKTAPTGILADQSWIEVLDSALIRVRPRSLKSRGNLEAHLFPHGKLSLEGQTLFFRLDDLSREVLRREPERMLQAQIFSSALLGAELAGKLFLHPEPPIGPGDLTLLRKARNRALAFCLLADAFFRSDLSGRFVSAKAQALLIRGRVLHQDGEKRLAHLLGNSGPQEIPAILSHRSAVFQWCRDIMLFQENPADS
jgi:competence protein ComEC